MSLHFPLSTGQVAQLVRTTEPKLAEEVRRGRVTPPPVVRAGRRLWQPEQVRQAAARLGLLTDELRDSLAQESADVR